MSIDSGEHPPTLEVTLGGNPFQCDWRMCWIKQAERDEWLTYTIYLQHGIRPECENFPDQDWDDIDLDCDVAEEQEEASETQGLMNEILNDILEIAA